MNGRYLLLSILLASLLAGCTWPSAPRLGPDAPAQTVTVEDPTSTPWPSPVSSRPSPTPSATRLPEGAVGAAVAFLATGLGVPEAQVSVIATEAVEWSDSSLDCPEPGMAYLTVITPGYRIILEVAGLRYEVHTDETGRYVAACE
jgi:hypothetical protein